MGINCDEWIELMAIKNQMICPFTNTQITNILGHNVVSYGLSSYGYDMRLSDQFKVFNNINSTVIDPKSFDTNNYIDIQAREYFLPPHSFTLATSFEYFKIPRNVIGICLGKSTYARCGLIVNVTPLEPEWEGNLTIELSNTTDLPIKVYAFEGIAQILFIDSVRACSVSYKDRSGKYQSQTGITLPRV